MLTTAKPKPSKLCLLCDFIAVDGRSGVQRVKRFISREHLKYVAQETYRVPDSPHCLRALEMTQACSPDFLLNHCLRSYAFAVAMAHKVKKPFDAEVLFLGSIMHDLGLTVEYDGTDSFEIEGAKAARAFCLSHDMEMSKADRVHEMVALHNSVGTAHRLDPETALLHFGAGADVAGLWIRDIHKGTLRDILLEYPRTGFKEGMIRLISEQIRKNPKSYMSTMVQLGFLTKIKSAPFPDQ